MFGGVGGIIPALNYNCCEDAFGVVFAVGGKGFIPKILQLCRKGSAMPWPSAKVTANIPHTRDTESITHSLTHSFTHSHSKGHFFTKVSNQPTDQPTDRQVDF